MPKKIYFLLYPALFWLCLILPKQLRSQTTENKNYSTDTAEVNSALREYSDKYLDRDDSTEYIFGLLYKAYNTANRIGYKQGQIKSSYLLGMFFISRSNPGKAANYYFESLKLADTEKDMKNTSHAYMGIGLLYYSLKDWFNANKYFRQALHLDRQCMNTMGISTQQYLIGICENHLKNYVSSKKFLDSALQLKSILNSEQGINECYMAIGDLYNNTGMYDSSLYYLNKALPFMESTADPIPLSLINCTFAEIYYKLRDYKKALDYGLKAKSLNSRIAFKDLNLNVDDILYKIYLAQRDYKTAMNYLVNYYTFKDSILNLGISKRISSEELNYEFEKQKNRNELLQRIKNEGYQAELNLQERKRKAVTMVALLSILLIIVIAFAYRLVNKEKKASEKLLLNILPKETADELKKLGKAVPKKHHGVSILFSDIENFTNIAEKLSPEDLVETLDYYFNGFDLILAKYGIEKIKTIGDAYMCVAGLKGDKPPATEAENLVNAAFEMVALHQELKNKFFTKFNLAFNFRIGIHTGSVISGVVGLKKYAYDIWGDAVNTAARMEQNSQTGRVNISGSTYQLVYEKFNFEYRGKIHAKNKGEIDMYFVSAVIS